MVSIEFRIKLSHFRILKEGSPMLGRWGGPLPQTWLDQQLLLQKKILKRMRELGMTPGMMFCFFATRSLPLPLFLSYSVCHPILFVLSINHLATFH